MPFVPGRRAVAEGLFESVFEPEFAAEFTAADSASSATFRIDAVLPQQALVAFAAPLKVEPKLCRTHETKHSKDREQNTLKGRIAVPAGHCYGVDGRNYPRSHTNPKRALVEPHSSLALARQPTYPEQADQPRAQAA